MYIRFAYVGFINEKEAHQFRSGSAGGLTCGLWAGHEVALPMQSLRNILFVLLHWFECSNYNLFTFF